MNDFDPEIDKRLTILAALESGAITAEEAERRLRAPSRKRGRPGKPPSRFRAFSVVTDKVTGEVREIPARSLDQSDIGTPENREIGRRYVELRKQHSNRVAMSRLQRELFQSDPSAPCSEAYILKCRRQYLTFLLCGHLIQKP